MSNLVERLRLRALARLSLKRATKNNLADAALDYTAAAALTLANARIARLEEALRPFDLAAAELAGHPDNTPVVISDHEKFTLVCVTAADLRRARAALKGDA